MKRRKEQNKMSKRLPSIEVSEAIPLSRYDESNETWVQFQRPRRWEREQISQIRARSVLEWDTESQGTVRQRDIVPEDVLDSERVALCLVDSNLCSEEGEQLFVPGKSCRQAKKALLPGIKDKFYSAWHDLPDDVAQEIIEKLVEWHPPFNWRNPSLGEA
jgi:hypothetical protein